MAIFITFYFLYIVLAPRFLFLSLSLSSYVLVGPLPGGALQSIWKSDVARPCASSPPSLPPVVPPPHHPVCPRFSVSAIVAVEPADIDGDMVQEPAARSAKWWSLAVLATRQAEGTEWRRCFSWWRVRCAAGCEKGYVASRPGENERSEGTYVACSLSFSLALFNLVWACRKLLLLYLNNLVVMLWKLNMSYILFETIVYIFFKIYICMCKIRVYD